MHVCCRLDLKRVGEGHSDELKPVYSGPDDDDHTPLVAIWHGIDSTLHILEVAPAWLIHHDRSASSRLSALSCDSPIQSSLSLSCHVMSLKVDGDT